MAYTLAVYASQCELPHTTQDSLPAAASFAGRFGPAGTLHKVSASHHVPLPPRTRHVAQSIRLFDSAIRLRSSQ